ncbi:hypothetical protein AVEN_33024-1 [Araneus ventricosus]|nr:hypothetical protein AVEN_33024-1 [Araneus ventricosus]
MEAENQNSSLNSEPNPNASKPTNQNQNRNNENEKKAYVPPITIDQAINTKELVIELNHLTDTPITGRCMEGKLKIFPTTAADHRAIRRFIDQKKLKAYTYELPEEIQLKIVIIGLPKDYLSQDIDAEFKKYGFNPIHIAPFKHRNYNSNPLFLVVLPKNEASKKIYDI